MAHSKRPLFAIFYWPSKDDAEEVTVFVKDPSPAVAHGSPLIDLEAEPTDALGRAHRFDSYLDGAKHRGRHRYVALGAELHCVGGARLGNNDRRCLCTAHSQERKICGRIQYRYLCALAAKRARNVDLASANDNMGGCKNPTVLDDHTSARCSRSVPTRCGNECDSAVGRARAVCSARGC